MAHERFKPRIFPPRKQFEIHKRYWIYISWRKNKARRSISTSCCSARKTTRSGIKIANRARKGIIHGSPGRNKEKKPLECSRCISRIAIPQLRKEREFVDARLLSYGFAVYRDISLQFFINLEFRMIFNATKKLVAYYEVFSKNRPYRNGCAKKLP